jgi:hypothetical protein
MNDFAPQGSDEWLQDRLGKTATASQFGKLLTAAKLQPAKGATARSYMMDIIAERITGLSTYIRPNTAMKWGTEHEADAAAVYEVVTDTVCTEVGFVAHPDFPDVGGSPDRLVGDDGGVEIKCPHQTRIHLEYRLAGIVPKEHVAQVQGNMWVTKRSWWDFVSYDPRIPDLNLSLFRVRVYPDLEYVEKLERAIVSFRDWLAETLEQITKETT